MRYHMEVKVSLLVVSLFSLKTVCQSIFAYSESFFRKLLDFDSSHLRSSPFPVIISDGVFTELISVC